MRRRQNLDRIGSNRIVHFSLRILRDLAFGFWFSSKIQTGFPNFFPVCLRSERQCKCARECKCAKMAARFWNLLCLIGVYNQLIPRTQPPITKLQSSKNFCYLSSINGESIALGTRNFLPFPGLLFRPSLKRIESRVHAINYSISKISKHGSTMLILPGHLFWLDLTIHMDIQCNPGPERLENSQINHLQPSDNSSSHIIKYTRSELLQLRLRQFKIPDETFHLLKRNGILRTRGVHFGQAFRNHKHNIAISHVQQRPDNTKPGERGVNLHNLCLIKRVKENKQPSKAPGGLEILHLNIRSQKKSRSLARTTTTCIWKEKRHYYYLWNIAQYHRQFSRDTNRGL